MNSPFCRGKVLEVGAPKKGQEGRVQWVGYNGGRVQRVGYNALDWVKKSRSSAHQGRAIGLKFFKKQKERQGQDRRNLHASPVEWKKKYRKQP